MSPVQPTAAWQCSVLHDRPWPSASLRYHAESQRCLLGAEVQARVRVCDTVNLHRWKAAASKVSPPLALTPYTWDLRVNAAQWVGDWNKRLWPPAALTSAVSTQLTLHPPPPNKPHPIGSKGRSEGAGWNGFAPKTAQSDASFSTTGAFECPIYRRKALFYLKQLLSNKSSDLLSWTKSGAPVLSRKAGNRKTAGWQEGNVLHKE